MQRVASVQALRGIAALSVVFYHVYIILRQPEYGGQEVFASVSRHGLLGVNFFFILSGFIMLLAHNRGLGLSSNLWQYLVKRFVRIYPVYWLFLTAYIAAAALGLGYPDFSWSPLNLLSSYMLVEFSPPTTLPLKIAWTLVFEVRFYLVFAIFFLSFRWGVLAFASWMVLVIWASFTGADDPWGVLSAWNIYFVCGMLVFLASQRLAPWAGVPLLFVGVGMLWAYASTFNLTMAELKAEDDYLLFFLAFAFSLIVLGSVLAERRYRLAVPRLMQFLGDASYSIYIVHSAAISAMVLFLSQVGMLETLNSAALFSLLFLAGSCVGIAAHLAVERPLMIMIRSRLRPE